jgi:hypothetical protein
MQVHRTAANECVLDTGLAPRTMLVSRVWPLGVEPRGRPST